MRSGAAVTMMPANGACSGQPPVAVPFPHGHVAVAELLQPLGSTRARAPEGSRSSRPRGRAATGRRSGIRIRCRSPGPVSSGERSSSSVMSATMYGCEIVWLPAIGSGRSSYARARSAPDRRRDAAEPRASRAALADRERRARRSASRPSARRRAASGSPLRCGRHSGCGAPAGRCTRLRARGGRIRAPPPGSRRFPAPARAEGDPPADERRATTRIEGISASGSAHRVRREDRQVGFVSRSDAAPPVLFERRVRRVGGEERERFGTRQPLLRRASRRRACRDGPGASRPRRSREAGSPIRPGKSLPPASLAPALLQRPPRVGSRDARGPTRFSAHGMSEVAWVGWIEAITPSRAKRGMSSGATTWACSIRGRSPPGGASGSRPAAFAKASSATRLPRSPIAWIQSCQPCRRASRASSSSRVRRGDEKSPVSRIVGIVREQRGAPASESAVGVGLDRAHGQEIAPPPDARPRAKTAGQDVRRRARPSRRRGSGGAPRRRASRAPRSPPARNAEASWTCVSPTFAQAAVAGQDAPLEVRGRDRRAFAFRRGSVALSTRTPGGDPSARRRIRPPSGSRVAAVDRAALSAARVDPDGVAVHPARDRRAVGDGGVEVAGVRELLSGPAVLIPAAPLRPAARGEAGRRSRRSAARLRQASSAPRRSAVSSGLAEPREVPVRVRPAGEDEASGQIARARRRGPAGRAGSGRRRRRSSRPGRGCRPRGRASAET